MVIGDRKYYIAVPREGGMAEKFVDKNRPSVVHYDARYRGTVLFTVSQAKNAVKNSFSPPAGLGCGKYAR